jgi:hypothetical protein
MTSHAVSEALWHHDDERSHPLHSLDLADAREAWRGYAVYAQHTMGRRDGHCEVVARLQSKLANTTVGVGRLGRASTVRFRANRTSSRHRRMTECETPSGHSGDGNPAAQQSPAVPKVCYTSSRRRADRAHLDSGPPGLPRGDPMTQREFITQDGSFGRSERERLSV